VLVSPKNQSWTILLKTLIMKKILLFLYFVLFVFNISNTNELLSPKVYIIPVCGDIEPGIAAFIERSLSISDNNNDIFILELDTFGGRVDSALKIVDSLMKFEKHRTIAYVKTKAISAGALISLACGRLVMKKNTTIGDCAPITFSSDGPQMLGEKFQSPLRAKFRTLAKRNDYPVTLAESMVTQEIEVYQVEIDGKIHYYDKHEFNDLTKEEKSNITKKTIVAEGELLTMDDVEAKELGFSKVSVSDISEIIEFFKLEDYEIVNINENWSEKFVRLISSIAPILMMIGLACIYIEMQAPGFGIFGLIGIICLSLVFFSQYIVGLANYNELLLLIAGILLFLTEIFILPGFGISGFLGILLIIIGFILSLQDFVIPNPDYYWQHDILITNVVHVVGSSVLAFITSLLFIRYVIPKFSYILEDPFLSTNLKNSHIYSKDKQMVKIGDIGCTLSPLRPSGKIQIGEEIIDVISEGDFIEQDKKVTIIKIKGNRIIVSG